MKLVFLNQYFPPDEAPTGLMLEAVAEECHRQGHEVTILCTQGGYAETSVEMREHPFEVVRLRSTRFGRMGAVGKICDYAIYYLKVAFALFFRVNHPDRVVALTTPPFLSLLAKLRGVEHAHWVMDLYPDVMIAHGMLRDKSILARLLSGLTSWGFSGSQGVLSLGEDMVDRLSKYHDGRNQCVPLWATTSEEVVDSSWREEHGWSEDEVIVMYSGNMGLGHRFDEFIQAARAGVPGIRFVFSGGGKRREEVEQCSEIELLDYVSRDHLSRHLSSADVHLVSQEPSWDGTMVPSKLQGIFTLGRPVIFVGSETSTIGRWVLESGGGWVVSPDDHAGLSSALSETLDKELRESKGSAARAFARKHFDRNTNVSATVAFLTA